MLCLEAIRARLAASVSLLACSTGVAKTLVVFAPQTYIFVNNYEDLKPRQMDVIKQLRVLCAPVRMSPDTKNGSGNIRRYDTRMVNKDRLDDALDEGEELGLEVRLSVAPSLSHDLMTPGLRRIFLRAGNQRSYYTSGGPACAKRAPADARVR